MNRKNTLSIIVGASLGLLILFVSFVSYMRNTSRQNTVIQTDANIRTGHPSFREKALETDLQSALESAKSNPNDFAAQIKAAEILCKTGKPEQAIEFLFNANRINPEDYKTIVSLGNAHFDSGKLEEAEKWYTAALQRKSDDHNVRTDLGLTFVFREKADYDRALQEFNTVLNADPNHLQSLQNSVVVYLKKNDLSKAKESFDKLQAINPKNPVLEKLKNQIGKQENR